MYDGKFTLLIISLFWKIGFRIAITLYENWQHPYDKTIHITILNENSILKLLDINEQPIGGGVREAKRRKKLMIGLYMNKYFILKTVLILSFQQVSYSGI